MTIWPWKRRAKALEASEDVALARSSYAITCAKRATELAERALEASRKALLLLALLSLACLLLTLIVRSLLPKNG